MITNGIVSVEDGNKAAEEYAPARKVKVEISFAVPEGEDGNHHVLLAGRVADAHVKRLLGREVTATEVVSSNPAKEAVTAVAVNADTTAKTTRKPRATSAKEPATGGDKAALEAAAGLTAGGVVETSVVNNTKVVEPVVEEDSLDDLLGAQAPVPITDAELAKAAQNKNAQMKVKDPNFSIKIRALVVEYAGAPPKKITDVPVAKRQEFLDKLRDLT